MSRRFEVQSSSKILKQISTTKKSWILHTSNRNDGEKALSCVLLHVIRLSRVAQLIVSRRVAGIRVGLLALLAYHFDVVASIPRYLVIKILPVLILKPAIPSKLQRHVFQSPSPRARSNDSCWKQEEKKESESFVYFHDVFFVFFSIWCARLKISWNICRDRLKFVSKELIKISFFFM